MTQEEQNKIKEYGAYGAVAASTYGIYKVGKLPDTFKGERVIVVSALLASAMYGFANSVSWSSGTVYTIKSNKYLALASFGFTGTLGYIAARTLFKTNPKSSLILGAVVGLAYIAMKGAFDAPAPPARPKPLGVPMYPIKQ